MASINVLSGSSDLPEEDSRLEQSKTPMWDELPNLSSVHTHWQRQERAQMWGRGWHTFHYSLRQLSPAPAEVTPLRMDGYPNLIGLWGTSSK